MGLGPFLRDRLHYIAFYVGFSLLALLVVQLDLWLTGHSLQRVNLAYILLLGLVGLGAFLWLDYHRQGFYRYLASLTGDEPLDELGVLPEPQTGEQELVARAWGRLYNRMRGELTAAQEQGRRNVRFMSQWAHHMKTPVAVIDLELQRVREQQLPPEVAAVLSSVGEENRRLQHALQMLLNTVRLESFAADLRPEPVDLLALVRRVINERRREFIVRRVYPRVEAPRPATVKPNRPEGTGEAGATAGPAPAGVAAPTIGPTVISDAKWLHFVLEQVVSNAIKYSARPDREGRVVFRFFRRPGKTVLEVADNGVGVDPADLDRVFEPFYTGVNGRLQAQSTGLGLYLAREVCRRLGHRLRLESVPGEGTRVQIGFPDGETLIAEWRPVLKSTGAVAGATDRP